MGFKPKFSVKKAQVVSQGPPRGNNQSNSYSIKGRDQTAEDSRPRSSSINSSSSENQGDDEEEYHFVNKYLSFQEEPIVLVEEESCPIYDIDNKEEELMPIYDTDIEDVIEIEEGFVGKGGFDGEEDNIKDVVVVVNDLCSLMIQTILSVDFEGDINTKSHELMSFEKSIIIKDVNHFGEGNPGFHDDHYDNALLTKDIGDDEEEYHFVNKYLSFQEESIVLVEEESCPIYDIDNKEEELMPIYDTDIEDVIEEEEGFVGKGGFDGEEDNIEDVVVVVNDLCSSMIQTILSVDFEGDINTKSYELMSFEKSIIIKDVNPFGEGNPGFHDDHYDNPLLTKVTELEPIIWDIEEEEEEE
nr:hypothetical protein [Tanacetum cinerariifolium]